MHTVGVFLIFAAVVLRSAVVLSDRPAYPIVLSLLAIYGLMLFGENWLLGGNRIAFRPPGTARLLYLVLQSLLTIGLLVVASFKDFLALLFVPISLRAVSCFGKQAGYRIISILAIAILVPFLFSVEGPLFGLAMAGLYGGLYFLFGGYAYQVQKAQLAHEESEQRFNELQEAHRQLESYATQMASLAMEQERNRLARELHDSVTQTVFSMNLAAQSAHLLFAREPIQAASQLQRIDELAAGAQREIQALVSHLKPSSLLEEELPAALRRLAVDRKLQSGLDVSVKIEGNRTLSPAVATNLYAIAQEALINVSRHSKICEAAVWLNLDKHQCFLEVEDHGMGFDPETILHEGGHLGLVGMYERANEIGWELSLRSRPGEGTRVVVRELQPQP